MSDIALDRDKRSALQSAKVKGESHTAQVSLSRDMSLFSVVMIGVGAMIGAGIFILTGIAAGFAGPALILAFFLNGVISIITAMSYAELSSALPQAGGGYHWVKKAIAGPTGFISGWMSWFAQAVAGSLYTLGFAAYFALLLNAYGFNFGLAGEILIKVVAICIAVILILINYRGASETGKTANIVALIKIVILAVFIISGLYFIMRNPIQLNNLVPFAPMGLSGILFAMGLTFIAFEGYEIIAQTSEEINNPKRNVPRAIFISLAIVIPIYLLVAFVALGAVQSDIPTWQFLSQYKELGLLQAAKQFMPFGSGAILLLIGGLVSTVSALNATIYSSTRMAFAMGRDYNLPNFFNVVSRKTKVPTLALLVSGIIIILMALLLPVEDVASAANVMFLLLFFLVNLSAIILRRKSNLDYGYKAPFFPVLQIIGMLLMLFLMFMLFKLSPHAWLSAAVWIIIGIAVYYGYSAEKETIESQRFAADASPACFNLIATLANEKTVEPIMTIASAIAKQKRQKVIALNVVEVPQQIMLSEGRRYLDNSRSLLNKAQSMGKMMDVKVEPRIILSHNATKLIPEFISESKTDIVVMGWSGKIFRSKIKRSVPDKVLSEGRCATCVLKFKDTAKFRRILVPIGPGSAEHFYRLSIASYISKSLKSQLTLATVIRSDAELQYAKDLLQSASDLIGLKSKRVIHKASSIQKGIIDLSEDFDLIIVGPSKDWILGNVLFGKISDFIANEAHCSVMMVKRPEHFADSWGSLFFRKFIRRKNGNGSDVINHH